MRAEADAARFTESAAAARAAEAVPSCGPRSPAPSWLYKPRASARRARRSGASSARAAPADAKRLRPAPRGRSLDERSATRRAAALRAQPSAVGGVGLRGRLRPGGGPACPSPPDLASLTNALLPRADDDADF